MLSKNHIASNGQMQSKYGISTLERRERKKKKLKSEKDKLID